MKKRRLNKTPSRRSIRGRKTPSDSRWVRAASSLWIPYAAAALFRSCATEQSSPPRTSLLRVCLLRRSSISCVRWGGEAAVVAKISRKHASFRLRPLQPSR